MQNIYNPIIILNFFFVWLGFYFPENWTNIIGVIAILSIGLIHGSNDIFIIKKLSRRPSFIRDNLFYIGFIVLFTLSFYFIPEISLVIFIIVSAYHFAEQHWEHLLKPSKDFFKLLFYVCYGNLIIGMILYFNLEQSILIIENLTGQGLEKEVFIYNVIFSFLGSGIFYLVLFLKGRFLEEAILINLFYLILFALTFYVSNLIWSFSIYFILWHSLPSLKNQIEFNFKTFTLNNAVLYFKQAGLFWVAAIISLMLFYVFLNDSKYALSILFAFIASVTIPHVFVMKKMFEKTSKKEN